MSRPLDPNPEDEPPSVPAGPPIAVGWDKATLVGSGPEAPVPVLLFPPLPVSAGVLLATGVLVATPVSAEVAVGGTAVGVSVGGEWLECSVWSVGTYDGVSVLQWNPLPLAVCRMKM